MTITLQLSPEDERALRRKAEAAGVALDAYALRILCSTAQRPSLDDLLRPVRNKFKQSGMTDEQVAEAYEAEKHAERAAQRGRPFDE